MPGTEDIVSHQALDRLDGDIRGMLDTQGTQAAQFLFLKYINLLDLLEFAI